MNYYEKQELLKRIEIMEKSMIKLSDAMELILLRYKEDNDILYGQIKKILSN